MTEFGVTICSVQHRANTSKKKKHSAPEIQEPNGHEMVCHLWVFIHRLTVFNHKVKAFFSPFQESIMRMEHCGFGGGYFIVGSLFFSLCLYKVSGRASLTFY